MKIGVTYSFTLPQTPDLEMPDWVRIKLDEIIAKKELEKKARLIQEF